MTWSILSAGALFPDHASCLELIYCEKYKLIKFLLVFRTSVKTSYMVRTSQNSLEAYRYIDCGSNSTRHLSSAHHSTALLWEEHTTSLDEVTEMSAHTPGFCRHDHQQNTKWCFPVSWHRTGNILSCSLVPLDDEAGEQTGKRQQLFFFNCTLVFIGSR